MKNQAVWCTFFLGGQACARREYEASEAGWKSKAPRAVVVRFTFQRETIMFSTFHLSPFHSLLSTQTVQVVNCKVGTFLEIWG